MIYKEISGNIFNTEASALVNTVNCKGVMGKGIALEFRRRYPEMFIQYKLDCQQGKLKPGHIYYYKFKNLTILNCAIKDHWRFPSKVEWVESVFKQFLSDYKKMGLTNIAFPLMGAQNGGIPVETIRSITRRSLKSLGDIDIEVYDFDPSSSDPLFRKLELIVNSNNSVKILENAGFKANAVLQIIDLVKGKNVVSLTQLIESKVLGEKNIDYLYIFLRDFSESERESNYSKQLSLF